MPGDLLLDSFYSITIEYKEGNVSLKFITTITLEKLA